MGGVNNAKDYIDLMKFEYVDENGTPIITDSCCMVALSVSTISVLLLGVSSPRRLYRRQDRSDPDNCLGCGCYPLSLNPHYFLRRSIGSSI